MPAEHRALPVTPAAVAQNAARVVAASAQAIHLHPKDPRGIDTLDSTHVADALAAVRGAVPDIPVGVTTGAWIAPDPYEREQAIRSCTLPDLPSVNWHETGTEAVASTLLDLGIDIEAGVWHHRGVEKWAASAHRDDCCRVLIECPITWTRPARLPRPKSCSRWWDRWGSTHQCCCTARAQAVGQRFGVQRAAGCRAVSDWRMCSPPGRCWDASFNRVTVVCCRRSRTRDEPNYNTNTPKREP